MWPVTFTLVVRDDPPAPAPRAVDDPPDAERPQRRRAGRVVRVAQVEEPGHNGRRRG